MPIGKKITLFWDSHSEEETFEAYQYHVYIKHGSPFSNVDTTDAGLRGKQQTEARNSFVGKLGESEHHIDASSYLEKDDEGNDLKEYQTYKLEYYAKNEGNYYFVIWARKDGYWYGPTYYPGVYKESDGGTFEPAEVSEDNAEQKPVIINDSKDEAGVFNLASQIRLFGLTYKSGPAGEYGSPASKSLGNGVSSLNIKNDSSPRFTFSTAFENKEGMNNIFFDAKSRVTIRKQNINSNIPSKEIYFEITGKNLVDNNFTFSDRINSIETAKALQNEDDSIKDYIITESGFAATNLVTEESIPIRNFDVVIEAYSERGTKTSAGNTVHDGIINDSENTFKKGGKYDIVEVNLLPPSGLMLLNEYSDRDGFVSPQKAYDKEIPYIAEPKINDKGDIEITLLESVNSNKSLDLKFMPIEEIMSTYFAGIKGGVVYYADQPFTLDPQQIKLVGEDNSENQKVTVKGGGVDSTITAKRSFFTTSNIRRVAPNTIAIDFPPFKSQTFLESNVVVGLFDELLYNKHFGDNGVARTQATSQAVADTILGEKNLSFSKVIAPLDSIDKFDPSNAKHLSRQPSSMALFRKSPVDEGAKARSFRAYIYISLSADGNVKELGSNGVSEISSEKIFGEGKNKPANRLITINLKEDKPYIPVVNYYGIEDAELVVRRDSSVDNAQNSVKILTPKNDSGYSEVKLKVENSQNLQDCRIFVGFLSPS